MGLKVDTTSKMRSTQARSGEEYNLHVYGTVNTPDYTGKSKQASLPGSYWILVGGGYVGVD